MPRRSILSLALALTAVTAALAPAPIWAQAAQAPTTTQGAGPATLQTEVAALLEAVGMTTMLDIMADEGRAAAPDLERDMFPGRGGSAWLAAVGGIYDPARMAAQFQAALPAERFTPEHLAELSAFFASDLGRRIVEAELAARRAFLDPEVEAEATKRAQVQAAENAPRITQLTRFITVNDLVERNVSGALNSNFQFYRGLSDGGAFDTEIPEEMMLAEVWGQEADIRADTLEWLYAFQTLAYAGLSDAEMEAYIALSQSPAGQALNATLFAAFDSLFEQISADLGRAAARFVAGEDT